jgi:hypothetical protein
MNGEIAYGEARRVAPSATYVDRGKDWPLAALFFTPVIAAYIAIGCGAFLAAGRVF